MCRGVYQRNEFSHTPNVVGQTGLHCGRDAKRLMHAAEVKESHVQMNGGCQMFERLAESQTQSRKAPKVRPNAQVCAFNVTGTDVFEFRVSADWDRDNRFCRGGVVPFRAFRIGLPVELEQLSEVNVRSESFFDCRNIPAQAVRRDLKSADNALAQVADKFVSTDSDALPDVVGQDHLRFGINRHPDVLVSPLLRDIPVQVGFLGVNERPKLISLHIQGVNVSHAAIEQVSSLAPDREKERENRAVVDSRGAGDGANTHTFKQETDDLRGLLSRNVVPSKRFVARFRKCGVTSGAAITLDSVASVESEPFCFVVLAFDAGHVGFSLVFLREKPDNHDLGPECGLLPRLDSALPAALTTGGALLPTQSPPFPCIQRRRRSETGRRRKTRGGAWRNGRRIERNPSLPFVCGYASDFSCFDFFGFHASECGGYRRQWNNPTLLIDELDPDDRSVETLRLLRTGTVAGVPAVRNGKLFSTYGLKIVASRDVPRDAALLSRCVIVSMLPSGKKTQPLDDIAMRQIAHRFQPELLMLRFTNYSRVKSFRLPSSALNDFAPRMKQVARALVAPIQGHTESESIVISALRERDRAGKIERALEPEWLTEENLFRLIHEGPIHSIVVGGIAASINEKLKFRGEDFRISARKIGSVLKSLGLKMETLGSLGRGLLFTPGLNRQIHAVAQHLGISRRTIATAQGLEAGYGGRRCLLCEEFGLTDGNDPSNRTPRRFNINTHPTWIWTETEALTARIVFVRLPRVCRA